MLLLNFVPIYILGRTRLTPSKYSFAGLEIHFGTSRGVELSLPSVVFPLREWRPVTIPMAPCASLGATSSGRWPFVAPLPRWWIL